MTDRPVTTPTAEELALARKCAASLPGTNALQKCAFIDGKWDDAPAVQAALAAIRETTERAAKLALQWRDENREGLDPGDKCEAAAMLRAAATECNAFASALRTNAHLKGEAHG